tara:strand:+ start:333 stop:539 length:207 start_codon:yes stop_codon:yes gene_type:complete
MIAHSNRHLANPLKVHPASTHVEIVVMLPPNVLLQPGGPIFLPDGIDLDDIKMIFHDHRVEEDGADEQ